MTVDSGLFPYDLEPPQGQLNPFDLLAPPRLLVPQYRPFVDAFTPEGRAELARRRAEDEAEAARNRELLTAATAEWETAGERLTGNAPALAVLAIHRPYLSWGGLVACTHCREDAYDEAETVPWACATYRAVTGEAQCSLRSTSTRTPAR